MHHAVVAVGVDNGGTWIRITGIDAKGRTVWSLRKPSPTVQKLPAFLHRHLKAFRGILDSLAVGSRGVWKPAARRSIKYALRGLAKEIVVMSDVEAAWLAAFSPHPRFAFPLPKGRGHRLTFSPQGEGGRRPDEGIIIISGTGSIAYGRTARGAFARAGGLGPEKSDEGSGYWIGKKWLDHKFPSPPKGERAAARGDRGEGASAVRRVAALAPLVIRKAKNGDPLAGLIIKEAQYFLSQLVVQLTRTLKINRIVPLSFSGSVLENKWFRSGLLRSLAKQDVQFNLVHKKMDPTIAPLTHTLSPLRVARGKMGRSRRV